MNHSHTHSCLGAIGPMFVIMGAMVPMMKMSALANIKSATTSAWRLFNLFDRQPDIDASSPDGAQPKHCTGQIEVRHLRDELFAHRIYHHRIVHVNAYACVCAGAGRGVCVPGRSRPPCGQRLLAQHSGGQDDGALRGVREWQVDANPAA